VQQHLISVVEEWTPAQGRGDVGGARRAPRPLVPFPRAGTDS